MLLTFVRFQGHSYNLKMSYCNMQMSIYFYTSFILTKCNETLKHSMYCERRMSWLLLLFDKHFSNNFQISSKYRNTALSFSKISLKNIICWKQMKIVKCSFFIKNFYYIFSNVKCTWNRETRHLLTKVSTFANSITRSTFCDTKLNIMMKR